MIGIICGEIGCGKTKRLLNLANGKAAEAKGSIVFIDTDNSYMFDLATNIRFINASEYNLSTADMLFGFISGIAAQDFDLECIYIDKFKKFVYDDLSSLKDFFARLNAFSKNHSTDVVISIGEARENLPEFLIPYLIQYDN